MAGDVFGNGMLLSKHIHLVAAFNHQHIFIDPNPESSESYVERKRMFELPRSSWTDYNPDLISKGGGVFNRDAQFINISREIKDLFGIEDDKLEPNELIKVILKANVELLWSAGIGTFVKSSDEINGNVGDRTNDLIRVNANELKCSVIGEGGNLGVTQKARIQYAMNGGRIFTDFIDNSGLISLTNLTGSFPVTSVQTLSGYHSIITDGQPSTTISGQGVIDYLIEINGLVVSSGFVSVFCGNVNSCSFTLFVFF